MDFLATGDASGAQIEGRITNNAFFPDIELAALQDAMRLDGTVTEPRLRAAAIEAVISVNGELQGLRLEQQALGRATLADVPAEVVAGESVQIHRYRRAVYCLAKANLIERYRDFDSTHDGHKRADELESPIDDLRRDARWAIRDILGRSRSTVELI